MRAGEIFCIPSSFLFLPLDASYIMLWVGLWAPFSLFIYKIFCPFTYQKNNIVLWYYWIFFIKLVWLSMEHHEYTSINSSKAKFILHANNFYEWIICLCTKETFFFFWFDMMLRKRFSVNSRPLWLVKT